MSVRWLFFSLNPIIVRKRTLFGIPGLFCIDAYHGNGYTTLYAHCLSLVVHAGQSVKQGQLIGYVGSTGRSSGNHCHFEIRHNGSYVAPQNVFNRSKYR